MKALSVGSVICMTVVLMSCRPAEHPTSTPPAPAGKSADSTAGTTASDSADLVSAPYPTDYPLARDACVSAVAQATGVDAARLRVQEVLWAQAGVGVTIQVPGSAAPWSCLSDEKGHVQGAKSLAPEGDN